MESCLSQTAHLPGSPPSQIIKSLWETEYFSISSSSIPLFPWARAYHFPHWGTILPTGCQRGGTENGKGTAEGVPAGGTGRYLFNKSSDGLNSIIRCPIQTSNPSGIMQAIPKIAPSRLNSTSPGFGASLEILSQNVSSEKFQSFLLLNNNLLWPKLNPVYLSATTLSIFRITTVQNGVYIQ